MAYHVPGLSVVFMALAALVGLMIPVALFIYLRKIKKADILPFWIGCAVFLVFALVLEKPAILLLTKLSAWQSIQNNIWLYGIIGGLFAGVFEGTGRFVAFKTVLKRKQDKDINALMYGAGHGGIEVLLLLVISMATNVVFSLLINTGNANLILTNIPDKATLQSINDIFKALASTDPWMFLVGIVERGSAVALHMSLSVLIWFAAKNKRDLLLFPVAVLLHSAVDASAVILAKLALNTWLIECVLMALSGLCALFALAVWKKNVSNSTFGENKALTSQG